MTLASCQQAFARARQIVGFSGAGISTASGIPDFRSPNGVWAKNRTVTYPEFVANEDDRIEYWRQKFAIWQEMRKAQPNAGHRAFVQLHEKNCLLAMITQNIDDLHQKSGLPREKVIELHGTVREVICLGCEDRTSMDEACERIQRGEKAPLCLQCGAVLKPAVVSFGQIMPAHEMNQAREACETCDLLVAVGSSLVVYPAAGFPVLAKQSGAQLVIINREATPLDHLADWVFHGEITEILPRLIKS